MKNCPKCKAEIQDNARFCLYCMTSFEEKQKIEFSIQKNKRWLYILAAVLVFIIIILSVFLFNRKDTPSASTNNSYSESKDFSDSSADTAGDTTLNNSAENSNPVGGESVSSNSNGKKNDSNSNSGNANTNSSSGTSAGNINSNSYGTSVNDGNLNSSSSTPSNNSTTSGDNKENNSNSSGSSNSSTSSITSSVSYNYRDAKYGDDFSVSANLDNCIVITGVKTASSNGEYTIPETINGKKVIAIMGLAFCDNNIAQGVKKVIVPSSVKTIWNYAFSNCYNLSDIYFKGNSIYTEAFAFPESSKRNGTLTIHCSSTCNDRNFRYYKNSASNYDAQYKEWNG